MKKRSARFAIVRSTFNEPITRALLDGALRCFARAKIPRRHIDVVNVPGSFELPVTSLWLALTEKYDAIICLGCVIRGETPHFEYVASEAARGINAVALATGVPVIFGVLTTEDQAQAWARAAPLAKGTAAHLGEQTSGNKGYEAAESALAMAALRRKMKS